MSNSGSFLLVLNFDLVVKTLFSFYLQFYFSVTIDMQCYFVYSIVFRQSYTLLSVPYTFSTHLAPCIVIIILLTIFLMLYSTFFWLFWNYQLVLLNTFTLLSQPVHKPPLFWQPSVCSLDLWVCFYFVCLFCSLDSTYNWNYMGFVFLSSTYFT